MLDKQALQSNWILRGSNIDAHKHQVRLAEIQVHRQPRKLSLIEELIKKDQNPIIVVPASDTPGNVCLKNVVRFLSEGRYQAPKDVK